MKIILFIVVLNYNDALYCKSQTKKKAYGSSNVTKQEDKKIWTQLEIILYLNLQKQIL
jgi:hypothetical protein